MRFSLNFIKEFLEVNVSAENLASLLTMAGMEVEHWEKAGRDYIFDIEVTTNRYDWLSMLGIARETACCLHKKLKVKYPRIIKRPVWTDKKIVIEDTRDCPFYIGRVVAGVTARTSPLWLKERISHCGIHTVNNVVDITNYCMLKWGNPLHAFDLNKIEGDIYIRRAKPGEVFLGIDDKQRILNEENLVIADDQRIIALAGVIGGKHTQVDADTKNVFLEAAIFSPLTIRRSRRSVGIDTDSSYRFERRVSPDYLEYASAQAARLMEELGGGIFSGYKQAGKKPLSGKKKISLSISDLNGYLGTALPKNKIKKILSNLEFAIEDKSKDKLSLTVPCFRFDVFREVDVYEEFSRIYGYENIPSALPCLTRGLKKDIIYEFKKEVSEWLVRLGLKEIITYSLDSRDNLLRLNPEENFIGLVNPLSKQEDVLRTTLLPGMIRSIGYNLNRDQRSLRFFEIAGVYLRNKKGFVEKPAVALGFSGCNSDFFHLKGVVENLLKKINTKNFEFKEQPAANFTNALMIFINGTAIGFLGKLDKKIKDLFDLKEDVFFAQMDIMGLESGRERKVYRRFSLYPVISKDISISLRKNMKFQEIEAVIKDTAEDYFAGLEIIDVYRGKDLPAGAHAFTVRIFYQAQDKTLTSQEITILHDKIREKINQLEGVELR